MPRTTHTHTYHYSCMHVRVDPPSHRTSHLVIQIPPHMHRLCTCVHNAHVCVCVHLKTPVHTHQGDMAEEEVERLCLAPPHTQAPHLPMSCEHCLRPADICIHVCIHAHTDVYVRFIHSMYAYDSQAKTVTGRHKARNTYTDTDTSTHTHAHTHTHSLSLSHTTSRHCRHGRHVRDVHTHVHICMYHVLYRMYVYDSKAKPGYKTSQGTVHPHTHARTHKHTHTHTCTHTQAHKPTSHNATQGHTKKA